jgi:hypothetical protein
MNVLYCNYILHATERTSCICGDFLPVTVHPIIYIAHIYMTEAFMVQGTRKI